MARAHGDLARRLVQRDGEQRIRVIVVDGLQELVGVA